MPLPDTATPEILPTLISSIIDSNKSISEYQRLKQRRKIWKGTLAQALEIIDQHGQETADSNPPIFVDRVTDPVNYALGERIVKLRLHQENASASPYPRVTYNSLLMELGVWDAELVKQLGYIFQIQSSSDIYEHQDGSFSSRSHTFVKNHTGGIASLPDLENNQRALEEFARLLQLKQ